MTSATVDPVDLGDIPPRGLARARRYAAFIRAIVGLHRATFITAVSGAFVYALCTVASSFAVRWVIDEVIVPRFDTGGVPTSKVVAGCAMVVGIGVLRAAAVVTRRTFATMTQWRIAETLASRVADRLVTQPVPWHQRFPDGQLIARGGVDTDTTIRVMAPIPFATSTVLLLIVAGVYLILTDTVMGLVAVAVFPILMLTNIVYEKRVSGHFDNAQEALGIFTGDVHESFEAVQLVKVYGAEQRETERLGTLAGSIRDSRIKAVRVRSVFEAALELIPALTNIGLVVLGAARVRDGQLTIGELSGFVYMFTLLVFPLRLIAYALGELPQSYAGYRRVVATLDDPIEADPVESVGVAEAHAAVTLDDVTFTYPTDRAPTIEHASATIRAGAVTAVVGPTGAGKSTLVELIGGLVPATSGRVAVTPGERAIVFQQAFLFGGTVRDNILLGLELDDHAVWEALRLARGDEFVRHLPDGLDTVVGERGVTLSGGQRQRVALARALVRRPSLLLLDDTTSALDPATELAVLDNLRDGLAGAAVLIVASRPSTVALADDVLYVADGRIVDHGTHDELMERVPDYRTLVEAFETDRGAEAGGQP
ncbi:MAG TPA: ABC transporter ATP-binding protein [Ilumatobacter sp.]|nr:ABC transporter ATP-binding protein [Ilumatobacter sp.]